MDFKFIDGARAVAVISCKSYLKSIDKGYRNYCRKVRSYVKEVWLFAECCPPDAVDHLREKWREAGYRKFWYLYPWDGERSIQLNEENCLDFLKSITGLTKAYLSERSRK